MSDFEPRYHPGLIQPILDHYENKTEPPTKEWQDGLTSLIDDVSEYAVKKADKQSVALLSLEFYLCIEQVSNKANAIFLNGMMIGGMSKVLKQLATDRHAQMVDNTVY